MEFEKRPLNTLDVGTFAGKIYELDPKKMNWDVLSTFLGALKMLQLAVDDKVKVFESLHKRLKRDFKITWIHHNLKLGQLKKILQELLPQETSEKIEATAQMLLKLREDNLLETLTDKGLLVFSTLDYPTEERIAKLRKQITLNRVYNR